MVQVVLVQCNLVDNQYQQKSEILCTFMPNKFYASRAMGALGDQGVPAPPNFLNTNVFFIIKNDKKKQKKFNVLKTEIQYHLHKMSLNKTSNISHN